MKTLSIKQPWAWLIIEGYKPIENRTWSTDYRGNLLIHASKQIDKEGLAWVRKNFPAIPLPHEYKLGGIIGMVTLANIVQASSNEWFFGPYGWVLQKPYPLPFKPCAGQLKLWDYEPYTK